MEVVSVPSESLLFLLVWSLCSGFSTTLLWLSIRTKVSSDAEFWSKRPLSEFVLGCRVTSCFWAFGIHFTHLALLGFTSRPVLIESYVI